MRTVRFGAAALCLGIALAVGAQAPPAAPGEQERRIAELIAELPGGSTEARTAALRAVNALVRIGAPAVPALIEATRDRDPWTRSWSANALGRIGDPRGAPVLEALLKDPSPLVRCVAVYYLGEFSREDPARSAAIADRLQDPDSDVRQWAARSLEERRLHLAAKRLEALRAHDDPDVRRRAFAALARVGGRDPAEEALSLVRTARDAKTLSTAYAVLREERAARPDDLDLFLAGLDAPHPEVQAEAVHGVRHVLKACDAAIAQQKKRAVYETLLEKLPPLTQSEYPPLRAQALYLLAFGRRDALLPDILKAMEDPDAMVRAYAVQATALAGVKDGRVLDALIGRLADEEVEVRRWAWAAFQWATDRTCTLPFAPAGTPEERARQLEALRQWRRERLPAE